MNTEHMKTMILQEAEREENWTAFLNHKIEKQNLSRTEQEEIRDFIERKAYLPLCEAWRRGEFPGNFPVRKIVNKDGSRKKRVVYSFPGEDGIFLKFIAFQLYRYDKVLSDNCYAFRRERGVRDAVSLLRRDARVDNSYCLKLDISNYFNSIDVKELLRKLRFLEEEDELLYELFERILAEDRVLSGKKVVKDRHGAMAGTPISPFFANIYLADVDAAFFEKNILYFRYSDDILLFADTLEKLEEYQNSLCEILAARGLALNPEKVKVYQPREAIEFLGFKYQQGVIDLSENTIRKTKRKIKRKAEALRRWQRKKGLSEDKAAIGFVRAMNRKFYGSACAQDSEWDGEERDTEATELDEFSWRRWFFPNLTTEEGLREIDEYLQEYMRYAVTGRHYKGNYKITYEQLKDWGYRSLVHEFYDGKKRDPKTSEE